MSRQSTCPHCDSPNVQPMALREHEGDSAVEWHQCGDCARMWSVIKQAFDDPRAAVPSSAWKGQMLRNA